jgi:hypothetical protein
MFMERKRETWVSQRAVRNKSVHDGFIPLAAIPQGTVDIMIHIRRRWRTLKHPCS